ncbi:MAG: hypothetical protein E6X32_00850 [Varibaculum cambriense]|uniref:hypothetical protein n=1 Tax=Varibaculum cambriense TaxID=184870 RepID=UPI00291163A0|nr:hypothetical protein [Varibaculum cambriense]MDU4944148.1 hypothetical protein [Varibaculum cambriense]
MDAIVKAFGSYLFFDRKVLGKKFSRQVLLLRAIIITIAVFDCLFLLYDGVLTQEFDIGYLLAMEALIMAMFAIRFPVFWIGYALTSVALIGGDEIYWAPIFPASNIALLDTFSFSPKRLGPAVLIPTVINVFFFFVWANPVDFEAVSAFSDVACFSVAGILVKTWMERSFQVGRDEQAAREAERRNLNVRLHDNVLRHCTHIALAAEQSQQDLLPLEQFRDTAAHEAAEISQAIRALINSEKNLPEKAEVVTQSLGEVLSSAVTRLKEQGFQVAYQCEKTGETECSRQQQSTVAQVVAELFENIFRYGDPQHPVTVDARISENSFRLETKNQIRGRTVDSSKMGLGLASKRMLEIGGLLTYGKRADQWQNLLQLEVSSD